jgi:hypothetical protein
MLIDEATYTSWSKKSHINTTSQCLLNKGLCVGQTFAENKQRQVLTRWESVDISTSFGKKLPISQKSMALTPEF